LLELSVLLLPLPAAAAELAAARKNAKEIRADFTDRLCRDSPEENHIVFKDAKQ
jgi:hypothetical protein